LRSLKVQEVQERKEFKKMKLARLILSIVMLLGFSSYAGATIINLGNGAFYYTGLTITLPQSLVNSYLSPTGPSLNLSSTLLGSAAGILPVAGLKNAVYQVSIPNNLKTANLVTLKITDLGPTGSLGIGCREDCAAPVPEPSTMLLFGTGLFMFVTSFKKLRWLA
jgi:hypothetical protein